MKDRFRSSSDPHARPSDVSWGDSIEVVFVAFPPVGHANLPYSEGGCAQGVQRGG